MDLIVPSGARRVSIEAVVIRCICSDPSAHINAPCPVGERRSLKAAYWHKNPLRRLWFKTTGRMT